MKQTKKQQSKVSKVMKEFKKGSLHSGKSGKIVKSQKQAVAIAMSTAKIKNNTNPLSPVQKEMRKKSLSKA
jgi:hypothetical protein